MCYIKGMKNLLLITGISGAGKTTASKILEDMGYTCIDQYPVELLPDLLNLIERDDSIKYDKVALTIPIVDLERFQNILANSEVKTKYIFLDADKETIINRYKFTRRIHPLVISNMASTVEEAVDIEKNILTRFKKKAHVLNTTNLSAQQHKEKLDKIMKKQKSDNFAVTFESFGYKNGVPDDADIILDVRMLDNPFYVEGLKELTGNDDAVKDYVLNSKLTQRYIKKLISYLDFTFKAYNKNEKRHLCVCIGCTGGQHRSVTITNYLYNYYKDKYMCYLRHRDTKK